jgi:predicted N-acetyltransferase YhbS
VTIDPAAIREITVADPLYAAERELRYRVLRAPLGMTRQQVVFKGEEASRHFVALDERGEVIGCALLVPQEESGCARLRHMAVAPDAQRRGIGAALVRRLEEGARAAGIARIILDARDTAIGFYARLGYTGTGEPFTAIGVMHLAMTKDLASNR